MALPSCWVFPPGTATPALFSLVWFAGVIELVGGALVALGLFTRYAAFIMSGEMAIGYFLSHAPHGFFPLVNRGEGAVLYCFIFLYLAVAGGGSWSLDRLISGDRDATHGFERVIRTPGGSA